MNKITLIKAFLILGILNGFGQSKKKDQKLTISVLPLFGSSDRFESGINSFVIKPAVGYYISDKTSIDLNFSYASLNDLTIENTDSHYNSYAFIPTLRNNFINKETLRLFAEIGFGLGTIKYDANNSRFRNSQHDELSGGISVLNIGIGGNYFFNKKFGLEIIIPYISSKNITSEKTNNQYSGMGPTFGLVYVLN